MRLRYPQGLPSVSGERCPFCQRRKNYQARLCRACSPVFKSYSAAIAWAREMQAGPCVLAYRNMEGSSDYWFGYALWNGEEKAAA